MKVTLLDHTLDPVSKIGQMAAICYDAKTDTESNLKRASHCKDKGHLATLRFAYATVNIQGISRVCSHQLVRIAIAGILQESQRYVKHSKIEFVTPPAVQTAPWWYQLAWKGVLGVSEWLYLTGVKLGLKKEDARYILPQACTTQLNLCLNFQSWRDVLNNRTKKSAQWEVRELAEEIQRQLHEIAPEVF